MPRYLSRSQWVQNLSRSVLQGVARVGIPMICRPEIRGELAANENLILAGNHVGHLDPLLMMYAASKKGVRPRFFGTKNLFTLPLIGNLLRGAKYGSVSFVARNSHRVDTDETDVMSLLETGIEALRNGEVLAGYPGARITQLEDLGPERLQTGLARAAMATGAMVQPVTHLGAQNIVPFDEDPRRALRGLWSALRRRPKVVITLGEPVAVARSVGASLSQARQGLGSGTPGEARGVPAGEARGVPASGAWQVTEEISAALARDHEAAVRQHPGISAVTDPTRPIDNIRAPRSRGSSS